MEELGFPGGPVVKNLPANTGGTRDSGSILRSGKSPGVGNGNPLQHSCLENSMDRVSLAGYSPWGCKEMDKTEQQRACTHTHTHTHTHTPLTFQASMQYCSLQHWTFTTRHIHSWASFLLCPSCFILSGAVGNCPPFFPSSVLDTFWTGRLPFWCHIFLPFHTVREQCETYTHYLYKTSNQQGTTAQHRDLCSMLCGDLCGRRIWKRIDRCICIYIMNHFAVHLTPIQHCKSTI